MTKNNSGSIGERLLNISEGRGNSNTIINTLHKEEEEEKEQLNFPMKTHREPKVIVFQEPGKKKTATRKRPIVEGDGDSTVISDKESFLNIAREVKTFGVTGFDKKFQKKDAQKYAEYLGAAKKKNQKVPYPILMAQKKRAREKETKQRELEQAMGIFKKKKREDKEKMAVKLNLGRWVDKSNLLGTNKKDTNVSVSKRDIEKVKRTKPK